MVAGTQQAGGTEQGSRRCSSALGGQLTSGSPGRRSATKNCAQQLCRRCRCRWLAQPGARELPLPGSSQQVAPCTAPSVGTPRDCFSLLHISCPIPVPQEVPPPESNAQNFIAFIRQRLQGGVKGVPIMDVSSEPLLVPGSELGLPRISQFRLHNCPQLLEGVASSLKVPTTV